MRLLIGNILLALAWAGFAGGLTPAGLLLGFFGGLMAIRILQQSLNAESYLRAFGSLARLVWRFIVELTKANLAASRVILRAARNPDAACQPAILAVPVTLDHPAEMVLLANMITATPGTITLEVDAVRRILYVHALDAPDPQAVIGDILQGLEQPIHACQPREEPRS